MKDFTIEDKTVMILYSRWMCMHYGEIANKELGDWFYDRLEYFLSVVLPNYKRNSTFEDHKSMIGKIANQKSNEDTESTSNNNPYGTEIEIIL